MEMEGGENGRGMMTYLTLFQPHYTERALALLLPVLDYKTAFFSVVWRVETDQVHTWCGVAGFISRISVM